MPPNELGKMAAEGALGSALSFERMKGIGPDTASKLKRQGRFRGPADVADATPSELTEIEGIGEKRAESIIEQAGGNPTRNEARSARTGSVSAAGIRVPVGDFRVPAGKQDAAKYRNQPPDRSETAVRVDSRRRAPVTTDFDKWKDNPGELDFPGVDTPSDNPGFQFKDRKTTTPDDIVSDDAISDLKFADTTAKLRDPGAKRSTVVRRRTMTGDNLSEGVRLNKTTGAVAGSAEWVVVDTTEGFGGDVVELTVESDSEHEQFDGLRETVNVDDVGTEWEVFLDMGMDEPSMPEIDPKKFDPR